MCPPNLSNWAVSKLNEQLKNLCIKSDRLVKDAAELLEKNQQKICFVIDANARLLGTVTDGDIRRGLLEGIPFDAAVANIMNNNPRTATEQSDRAELRAIMTTYDILHMPVVDADNRLIGLITLDELRPGTAPRDNWVVLMAGGLGERLRPLTNTTPKPLLHIGDKPLLQSILENFIQQNFRQFYISVNYRADAIKSYFGDGSAWGATIIYLEEEQQMGTAGALTLMPDMPSKPVIVMNGDLVTRTSFSELLNFHTEQKSKATMCVREYDFQVPFGVISIDGHRIAAIDEKPVHRFLVNAGIYVLEPEIFATIPENTRTDMTSVFNELISTGKETAVFPIHEYWLDIGHIDDFERANSDMSTEQNP